METDFPLKHNKIRCLILMGSKSLASEEILDSTQNNIWETITVCRLIDLLLLNSTRENRGKALLQLASKVKWNQTSLVHVCAHTHKQNFHHVWTELAGVERKPPHLIMAEHWRMKTLRRQFITMVAEKTTETVTERMSWSSLHLL